MDNLEIYNKIKEVPEKAQKKITGGRLNGMTDIKPMWRIEKLTELFGVCGFGWKAPITNKEIIDGANGEKIAIVDINLYIKIDGEWSEPIQGTGGSSFISNEKNGLYTSDECFKMAYTDALSVACKSLGMGANVYWGDSKYNTTKITTREEAENFKLLFGKHKDKTLIEAGYKNSVSVPTGCKSTEWITTNWTWLEQFEEVILWYDNDEAGKEGVKEVFNRLPNKVVKVVYSDICNDINESDKVKSHTAA